MRQAFLSIFAEQVLNSEWNISEPEKVAYAAKHYLKMSSVKSETELKSFWKRLRGVPPVLSLLDDITVFKSLFNKDTTLFEK